MKIAFVSQPWNTLEPPVKDGSIAILTYEVAKRLAATSDVVVYSKLANNQTGQARYDNVDYKRFSVDLEQRFFRRLTPYWKRFPGSPPLFGVGLYFAGYATRIARDLRSTNCDVVQIFNFSQFASVIRRWNPRVKIVLRMSCEWLTQLDRRIIEKRLDKIDAIVGCSDYITEKIRNRFPNHAKRCVTILNGRDVNAAQPSQTSSDRHNGQKRLLYVGRVSPEKGVHVLLEAFVSVAERFPDVSLEIVGPRGVPPKEFTIGLSRDEKVLDLERFYRGERRYQDRLEDMIPESLAGRVTFSGFVPHPELGPRYQSADVFVFPSIWGEPSGNPPIEAMVHGTPVVTTNTGGTPEYVIDGKTGLLVPPSDAAALAAAIARLLENDELRKEMGRNARQHAVDNLSYERYSEELLALYREVVDS